MNITDFKFVEIDDLRNYLDEKIYNDIIFTLKEYENMNLEE